MLAQGFAAMREAATFSNARVLLNGLFGVRSEVVSGRLERMLELSGVVGIVVLGVNPRLVYEGACAGRHAVVLASSSCTPLPPWGSGFLDVQNVRCAGTVTIVDPSEPAPSRMSMEIPRLAAAFDAAGREGLVIHPSAGQPASRRQA